MNPPQNCVVRTFLVATSKRDTTKYPHPSDFTYDLPVPIHNVVGISVRDYKFGNEPLINENNKTLSVIVGGVASTITLAIGNYNNSITDLCTALNTAFTAQNTTFAVDGSNRVRITYTGPSYILIKANTILRILGFLNGKTIGVCIRNSGVGAPTVTDPVVQAVSSITATQPYDTYNLSEMVVRITDVETIMSNDMITNRCSAVLFSSSSANYTVKQCLDHYIPLLQQQSRLQSLKIKLLNMDGDLYDTINNEAVMLLEFYCLPREC